jgi:Flp pilus assembly protein TadB
MHGVGYYSFSTNEETRRKQMEELQQRRAETLRAQAEAEQTRKQRDELVASRLAAARAARRQRAGLPPEQPQRTCLFIPCFFIVILVKCRCLSVSRLRCLSFPLGDQSGVIFIITFF